MKFIYIKSLVVCLTILCLFAGCSKLKLQKDESLDPINAGENLKHMSISQFLAIDHTTDHTSLNLFADAIKRAGLSDLLNGTDNHTVIMLNNDAVNTLVSSLGYQSLTEVPPVLLKNILSDLIFKEKVLSYNLNIGETKKYETINGNYIYVGRERGVANDYVLYINKSPDISSPAVIVRSQNLEFNNGVAHAITAFTYYRLAGQKQDDGNAGGGANTEKLFVSKDVFVQNGTANRNRNFNDPATIDIKNTQGKAPEADRLAIFQYPLTIPTFGKRIGSAKLNVYVYLTGLNSATKFSFSAYKGEDKNWDENTITWVNAPTYNQVALSTVAVPGETTGWITFDITSAVSELYANNKEFINITMNHDIDNFIKVRPREFSGGAFKSFISVSNPPPTILSLDHVNTLAVKASEGIKTLGVENLKMNGTADKNIFYTLTKEPENGFLVKYGIPLKANSGFSQEDLAKGGIKYLYKGNSLQTDQVIFEARDHNGGYYPTLLNLAVTIN